MAFDEKQLAASMVYAELIGAGMEDAGARAVSDILESDDEAKLDTWYIAARPDGRNAILVELYADLDTGDLDELERLRQAGAVCDYRSLRDVRDAMVREVRARGNGSWLLADAPLAS